MDAPVNMGLITDQENLLLLRERPARQRQLLLQYAFYCCSCQGSNWFLMDN